MAEILQTATRRTVSRMPPPVESAFRAGDQIQRQLMGLIGGAFGPSWREPRSSLRTSIDVLQQSAEILALLMPGHERTCDWREMQNKVAAYKLFEHIDTQLAFDHGAAPAALARRAVALEPATALFALEGLGHYLAETHDPTRRPQLIPADLPSQTLLPLHVGVGMSFAARVMARITPRTDRFGLRGALADLVQLCRGHALPGYESVIFEPLGLVTRNLHPRMLNAVASTLEEFDPKLAGFFWHGVGRALYFSPTHFVPCGSAHERSLQAATTEPPSELGKRNALAGLVWATTLVNFREPQVVQALWKNHARLIDPDAFSNGVVSALMLFVHSTSAGWPMVDEFMRPPGTGLLDHLLWQRLVRDPAVPAIRDALPGLAQKNRIGEIFQFHSLSELAHLAGLEQEVSRG